MTSTGSEPRCQRCGLLEQTHPIETCREFTLDGAGRVRAFFDSVEEPEGTIAEVVRAAQKAAAQRMSKGE